MKRTMMYIIALVTIMIAGCGATIKDESSGENTTTINKMSHHPERQAEEREKEEFIKPVEKPEPREVKGIYLNRYAFKEDSIDDYIDLIKSTDLNAVVMDVKDDFGMLTYDSEVELANEINSDQNPTVEDMTALLERLKEEGIYTIARVVVFKDPYLAEQKSDFAMKRDDGTVWQDQKGVSWIDPYHKEVWQYVTNIAEEAATLGFDEIQYDYVRFPDNAQKVDQEVAFANSDDLAKDENIASFLRYSNEQLANQPVYVSADVFGLVTTAEDDMGIGQTWEKISQEIDYISPMTYPSHYAPNSYGIANPDDHPYDIMKQAMEDAVRRNNALEEKGEDPAIIRPWIQDFDFKRPYTEVDIQNQIKALEEQGITQYLVWNASSEYTENAFQ
ncbi:putative glycoside hydrolase [Oceanobacillus halotolerans]|uniref:putative glycoside hydrolase n=1 Tax=Oceanobacillus halotolerans TaxID=2663380 RepID=UPI0013DA5D30|nr:putative glycoside hydrolase [Oceanobacillus halotolerans]